MRRIHWIIWVLLFMVACLKGLDLYEKRVEALKAEANALVETGWKLEQQWQIKEAQAHYQKALELDKKCYKAYKHFGTSYGRLGEYDKAMKYFEKAIELNPLHSSSYYNKAIIHEELNEIEEARKLYQKALEIKPTYKAAKQRLELVNLGLGITDYPSGQIGVVKNGDEYKPYFVHGTLKPLEIP